MRVTRLLLSLFFTHTESKVVRISLDGVGIWSLSNANSTVSTAASVPGYVHTTLQSAGVTGDAYYRFNDDALAWVRQDVWTYTRAFDAPDAVGSAQRVELCFDGIDTVAEVRLNGALVASTENQHRRYRADVTNRVNPTDNKLRVTIYPAVPYGNAEAAKYPLPVPQEKFQPEQLGNRTFVRKQQCDWGWDWGPALAPAGIWRSVAVEAYDEARITDIVPAVSRAAGGAWTVSVRVFARFAGTGVAGSFSAQLAGATAVVNATAPAASCLVGPAAVLSLSVPESAVKLWWPAGYGAQPLYNLTVVFSGAGGETDEMTVRVGFREVEVVEDAIDDKTNPGTSFYLRVNGVPIFGKGSNWIPGDAFDTRFSDSDMRRTLQSAVDANQNIVRVWGGGNYQRDAFYDACDELGLMVWLDFMHGGSLSPRHQSHLDNWDAEVRDNVRRIASHPSLVVYCGNNEAFKGISSTGDPVQAMDYAALFDNVVRRAADDEDPARHFHAASPSNGYILDDRDRAMYIHRMGNPFSGAFGDTRHYDYTHYCLDTSLYPRGRFVSEYGWQSFPSFATLSKVRPTFFLYFTCFYQFCLDSRRD